MIVSGQQVVNALPPGLHRLDRRGFSEFDSLYSWPEDFAGPVEADIVFVSTAGHRRFVWQLSDRAAGENAAIEASGTIDVDVTEPERFASWHLARSHIDDAAIRLSLERAITAALRPLLATSGTAAGPSRDAIARSLRSRLRTEMASRGIVDFSIRIRRIERPDAGMPPVDETPASSNVAHLAFDRASAEPPANAAAPSAAPPSIPASNADETAREDGNGELDAILELEREIERLDAWSTIGQQPTRITDDMASDNDELATTPPARLPESFHALRFYIAIDMEQAGPFDAGEFEQALREGVVTAQTLVWFQGMDDWRPAGDVPEIAALL